MRILIADDEPLARERLRTLVQEMTGCEVAGEAGNGVEVLALIDTVPVDTVLLDIRMPAMDGLETARHLDRLNPAPAVIFTTAYQDHALAAFESCAVDYLLKPVRRDRLAEALGRARVISRGRLATLDELHAGGSSRNYLSAIVQGHIQLAPVADIRYLRAEQKYVTAVWPDGELLLDESLKTLEEQFPDRFLRIHRNTLIALQHVDRLERDREGNCRIHMRDIAQTLAVSRRHLSQVKKVLRGM